MNSNRTFSFFENYYRAYKKANDKRFLEAIILFVYEGKLPTFDSEDDQFLWEMIYPNLNKSRSMANRDEGKKGGPPKGSRNNPNGRKKGTNSRTNSRTN